MQNEDENYKVNNTIRNFDWESIGVTGFEEVKDLPSENVQVEVGRSGLGISENPDLIKFNGHYVKKLEASKEFVAEMKSFGLRKVDISELSNIERIHMGIEEK